MYREEGCQSVRLLISEWGRKLSLTSSWVLPEQRKSLTVQALKACTPPQVFLFQCGFTDSLTDLCGSGGRAGAGEAGEWGLCTQQGDSTRLSFKILKGSG